jgi:hypothetical protein
VFRDVAMSVDGGTIGEADSGRRGEYEADKGSRRNRGEVCGSRKTASNNRRVSVLVFVYIYGKRYILEGGAFVGE